MSYHFEDTSNFVPKTVLKLDMFRPLDEEQAALFAFRKRLLHFCLLKDSYQINKKQILESLNVDMDTAKVEMVHMQEFCALYDKHLQPDVTDVVYVSVLYKRAYNKDTVLTVVKNSTLSMFVNKGRVF